MAFAAVVKRFASTNKTRVAAYAAATGGTRHDHPRRASGMTNAKSKAATPERKLATCHPLSAADLIAAPPVENSSAVAIR